MTEDEMAGWHHRLKGHESGWTLGVGDGQGGLAWCSPQGHKESDTTEGLNLLSFFQAILFPVIPTPLSGVRGANQDDDDDVGD